MADETVSRLDIARQRRQQLAAFLAPCAPDAIAGTPELAALKAKLAQARTDHYAALATMHAAAVARADAVRQEEAAKDEETRTARIFDAALLAYAEARDNAARLGGVA